MSNSAEPETRLTPSTKFSTAERGESGALQARLGEGGCEEIRYGISRLSEWRRSECDLAEITIWCRPTSVVMLCFDDSYITIAYDIILDSSSSRYSHREYENDVTLEFAHIEILIEESGCKSDLA
ncbi:hypothetical protein Tco_1213968 [Tanacetum coccineum]